MNRHWIRLLLLAAAAPLAVIGQCAAQGVTHVRIVDEANLPPERLADALAAKAMLDTWDPRMLRRAAQLAPRDPLYWYLSAITRPSYLTVTSGRFVPPAKTQPACRRLLERSLAVDPSYLPALYAYVMTKPTYEQRMQGLHRLSILDSDNAKPYYLMAIECYEEAGKTCASNCDAQSYVMSREKWQTVIDLIREGNKRPAFHADVVRVPSTADLRARARGKALSPAELGWSILQITDAFRRCADCADAPVSIVTSPGLRQLAHQVRWEAGQAYKQDRQAEALDMLDVIKELGSKYAASEPRGLGQLCTGSTIRVMADDKQADILRAAGDEASLRRLAMETASWMAARTRSLKLRELQHKYDLSPAEWKRACDQGDAEVTRILERLGLGRASSEQER
jgi:hypothetical protein